jgi:hypothetical protein
MIETGDRTGDRRNGTLVCLSFNLFFYVYINPIFNERANIDFTSLIHFNPF